MSDHGEQIQAVRDLCAMLGGHAYVCAQAQRLQGSAGIPDMICFVPTGEFGVWRLTIRQHGLPSALGQKRGIAEIRLQSRAVSAGFGDLREQALCTREACKTSVAIARFERSGVDVECLAERVSRPIVGCSRAQSDR